MPPCEGMRLVAAIAGALAVAGTAGAAPPRAVFTIAESSSRMSAFAMDGDTVAWANGTGVFARAGGRAFKAVRFGPNVVERVSELAVARRRVVYALESEGIRTETYVGIGSIDRASPARPTESLLLDQWGVGERVVDASGDGEALTYLVRESEEDPACTEEQRDTGNCFGVFKSARVMRVVGGKASVIRRGDVSRLSAASPDVALVSRDGLRVEIVRATSGRSLTSLRLTRPARAIALTRTLLAVVVRCGAGSCVEVWSRASGALVRTIPLPPRSAASIDAEGDALVYAAGREIRAVDLATFADRRVAEAAYWPRELATDGGRVAWVEHVGKRSRIRATALR